MIRIGQDIKDQYTRETMNIDRFTVIQTWSTKKFHKNIESLRASMMEKNPEFKFLLFDDQEPVSYTHLTLPTNREV